MDVNKEYFSTKPHSVGGKNALYEKLDKNKVDKALTNNYIYNHFKQHKQPRKFSPIYVYKKRVLEY